MPKETLDELDLQLIKLLGQDSRISNLKIASQYNVTEGTVRSRIKRLERENLIRFTAVTNVRGDRRVRLAFIRVQADLEQVPDIAARLKELPSVGAILVTMGRFNLLVISLFDDLDDLHLTASEQILSMPGVRHIETAIEMKTLKTNFRVARIID